MLRLCCARTLQVLRSQVEHRLGGAGTSSQQQWRSLESMYPHQCLRSLASALLSGMRGSHPGPTCIVLRCALRVQVSRLMQAQKEQLADERAVILGEHKKELQTLVSVMSASVNRDLPARIEGMVTREVRRAQPACSLLAARNRSPCRATSA